MQATLNAGMPTGIAVPQARIVGRAPASPPRGPRKARAARVAGAAVGLQALILLAMSAGIVYAMVRFRDSFADLGNWGYLGVALAELSNSAAIMVPTPAPVYTFAMGSVLNPVVIGLIGGAAAALGEVVGYFLGASGHIIIKKSAFYGRFHAVTQRWGGSTLFVFAALPVPFDIAGIWAGAGRYPIGKFLAIVTVGKVIKVTAVALAGYYGLRLVIGS